MPELSFDPLTVLFFVVAFLPAVVVHEVSHGWMAVRLGDPSPRMYGRLTLNPAKHIDVFGTIIVPALLLLPVLFGRSGVALGYAKPMPLNPSYLKNERQLIWVMAAGPVTNILVALVGAVAYRLVGAPGGLVFTFFDIWIITNLLLAMLNLFPIPPLDGSRVLALFLPPRAREVFESWQAYGALFILVIVFIIPAPVIGLAAAAADGLRNLLVI